MREKSNFRAFHGRQAGGVSLSGAECQAVPEPAAPPSRASHVKKLSLSECVRDPVYAMHRLFWLFLSPFTWLARTAKEVVDWVRPWLFSVERGTPGVRLGSRARSERAHARAQKT